MACTLSVTSTMLNTATGDLTVTGVVNITGGSCTGSLVDIKVTCGTQNYSGQGVIQLFTPALGVWTGVVPGVNCICNDPIIIFATLTCFGPPSFTCSVATTISNLCCCPTVTTVITPGSCTGSSQLYSFDTYITINDSCTYSFRRNFGDGTFGGLYTFTGSGSGPSYFTIPTETHYYLAPTTYTSNLDVVSPTGCGTATSNTFPASCGSCYPSSLIEAFCKLFEFNFLLASIVGIVLSIASPCTIFWVPLGFFIAATLFLGLYFLLQCDKCACAPLPKAWGRIFISIGIILFMFIFPSCSSVSGGLAFALGLLFIYSGFIALSTWYNSNKITCPLTICDYWCAVGGVANIASATNLAIIGALIVWAIIGTITFTALGLALFVAIIIIAIANAALNANNPPCNNTTSTCQ